jgi:hypothetical protein
MSLSGSAGRTLTVYLAADADRFKKGIKQADTATKGLKGKMQSLGSSIKNNLGTAFATAGIAAAGAAIAFGVEGVKAAIADEKAAASLAKTMENLGLSMDTQSVEDMIDSLQLATGVADDKLRPAFDRLIRSTGNTEEATSLLQLAMDISAGTGKDLNTVVGALGKAADGNIGSLKKLGIKIDDGTIKSNDFKGAVKQLSDTFEGQAAVAAETWQGKIDRVTVAFGELQESFGTGFLSGLDSTDGAIGDLSGSITNLRTPIQKLGEDLGKLAGSLGYVADLYGVLTGGFENAGDKWGGWAAKIGAVGDAFKAMVNPVENMVGNLQAIYDLLTGKQVHIPDWLVSLAKLVGIDLSYDTGPAPGQASSGYGRGAVPPAPTGNPNSRPFTEDTSQLPFLPNGSSTTSRASRSRGLSITVNTGVGDPVAIAKDVRRVLELERRRTG